MNKELNNSKIDVFNRSVQCGFCKMKWGLEEFDTEFFCCKRCGTTMIQWDDSFMPTRDLSIIVNDFKKQRRGTL